MSKKYLKMIQFLIGISVLVCVIMIVVELCSLEYDDSPRSLIGWIFALVWIIVLIINLSK